MCGIAGFWASCSDAEFRLKKMADSIVRRGPDGRGIWLDAADGIGMAHTRLSIIDLSNDGLQPMTHGNGRLWITFNGEIYNYKELRVELECKGIVFSTHTDTEVILAGWNIWGIDTLKRLRGMFAFAIWDRVKKQLILCRDRMGIKPLLWAETAEGFIFGSTVKAILASGFIDPILEPKSIYDLFSTGSVCQPGTIIRGIYSLEPGTCTIIEAGLKKRKFNFWDLPNIVKTLQPELANLSYADAVHLVRDLLNEACRYHLIADVSVGSFLSGGIDSTAITSLMSRHMNSSVKSFSIGFEQTGGLKHELGDARLAAQYIGCDHTEVVVTGNDAADAFDDLICTIDQPSYDGANTFFVSRAASTAAKVAISGLGGDELFAGYEHFVWLQNASKPAAFGIDHLYTIINQYRSNRFTINAVQSAFFRKLSLPERYAQLRRSFTDTDIENVLEAPFLSNYSAGFLERYLEPLIDKYQNSLTQTSLVECRHYLLNTLLRDADVMSMGHGLEVRPMMLDHKLVEYSLALPERFKVKGKRKKAVLKDAVADILPSFLLTRPKTGFELPLGYWLRNQLQPRLLAALNGSVARSLFKPAYLKKCITNSNDPQSSRTLWTMLVLITWIEENNIRLV